MRFIIKASKAFDCEPYTQENEAKTNAAQYLGINEECITMKPLSKHNERWEAQWCLWWPDAKPALAEDHKIIDLQFDL